MISLDDKVFFHSVVYRRHYSSSNVGSLSTRMLVPFRISGDAQRDMRESLYWFWGRLLQETRPGVDDIRSHYERKYSERSSHHTRLVKENQFRQIEFASNRPVPLYAPMFDTLLEAITSNMQDPNL